MNRAEHFENWEDNMRKLLNKLIAAVSAAAVAIAGVNFGGIGGLTAAAESPTGDFTVTGGTAMTTPTQTVC